MAANSKALDIIFTLLEYEIKEGGGSDFSSKASSEYLLIVHSKI